MDLSKAKKLASDVKLYWKTPPLGRYMPFKEVAAYSVGGIGVYFLIYVVQQLTISVNNFLISNAIGIAPEIVYVIYIISVLVGFPATAIRANIIDNTRNRKGKYRPYILTMGIPACILAVGFVMVPYEKINNDWINALIVLAFNIGFQFFYMFFYDSYENLIYVLSPNSQERADVASVKSIIYSIAPSIATALMPIAAKYLTGGSMVNLRLYRVVYPPMAIIGILISVLVYANTQEKIIQAKTHVVKIKFFDAIRAVAKNKYFWIISLAGWLGFLEGFYGVILQWLYQYRHACSPGVYSIVGLIYGNASFWGMLAAPFAIRKYGKKKVLVFTNLLNIIFIAAMYPIVEANPENMIWLILICLFMNGVAGAFAHILNPSIQGDIRDYQQYVTGERIDGMFSTVGLIGSVITLATSGVLPAVYKYCGISMGRLAELVPQIRAQETQYIMSLGESAQKTQELLQQLEHELTSEWSVLYIDEVFTATMAMLIGLSVIGATMNVVPYFFYDLSETRQKGMVKVLKIRAMFEDYGNGVLSDKDLVETIDIIREANEMYDKEPVNTDKALFKGKKKERRKALEYNENIEVSKIVIAELTKFSDPVFMAEFNIAKEIYNAGIKGLTKVSENILAEAEALPATNKTEKKIRKERIQLAKLRLASKKIILKEYNGELEEFDTSAFEPLFEREDACNEAMSAAYENLSKAKKAKDKEAVAQIKTEIALLKKEQKEISAEIKKVTDANSAFSRAAKPYLDAKRLIVQEENYKHYDDIDSVYEEAKARAEEAARLEAEEAARLEAEKEAYAAKLKAEKLAKRQEKKEKSEKK